MSSQQQAQPTMQTAPSSNTNPFGIGAVYRDVTCAVSSTARAFAAFASGVNAVATNFETNQWISDAETAVKTCTRFNVTREDGSPLTMIEAVLTIQQLKTQLRGY